MNNLDQFRKQKYLNLETFRKNGESMKTPVWFVQDGGIFYVCTGSNSGKVKRIHNNGRVKIAPCKMNGKLIATWISARAREITDPEICMKVKRMLDTKYGLMKKLFDNQRTQNGARDTILEIKLVE